MKRRRSTPSRRKGSATAPPRSSWLTVDRLALLVLWALIWLAPLVFDIRTKDNFRLPKELLSEILVLTSLVFLCFKLWGVGALDKQRILRHPAILAAFPLLGVALLGRLLTEHPHYVSQGVSTLGIGLAALVGWSLALGAQDKRRLLFGMVAPATLISTIAILQTHQIFTPFEFAGRSSLRRGLTSMAGGALDLGTYLVLPVILAQIGLYRSKSPRQRGMWGGALALCLYAIARTQTLTALAAVLAASLVLWATLLSPRRRAMAGILCLLLSGALVLGVGPLRKRAFKQSQRLARGEVNSLLTGRLDGWRAALRMLEKNPWLGVGQGAYTTEFADTKVELSAEGVAFFKKHFEAHFASAHNEFLEAGAELGGLGLLALGWALWQLRRGLIWHAGNRSRCQDEEERAQATADLALMRSGGVALLVLSLASFPLHLAIVAYPFILLLSWILGIESTQSEEET